MAVQLAVRAGAAVDQIGIIARRMMIEAGVTREHFGAAAIACRTHARRNPMALMQKPLTMEEYLGARMIGDPMCLFDCCLESDRSLACVLTSAERARDLRQRPAYLHAAAQGMGPNASIMTNHYKADFLSTANTYVARDLCGHSARPALRPALRCLHAADPGVAGGVRLREARRGRRLRARGQPAVAERPPGDQQPPAVRCRKPRCTAPT